MTQKQSGGSLKTTRRGTAKAGQGGGSGAEFEDGKFWIGRHAADADVLVFDPSESGTVTDRVSLYSLAQHRNRTFPLSVVHDQIRGISDEDNWEEAKRNYEDRAALRHEREEEAAAQRQKRMEHQRQGVIGAHERYLAGIGIEDAGVIPTPENFKPGRRSKCQVCGIVLDDFASSVCLVCNGVLCSCGACACPTGKASR
jgi:hypothetical protein